MPHSLAELLETRQALEVIPGVLYFASVGERLRSLAEPPAPAAHPANVSPQDEIEASAARAAMEASMWDAPRISHRRGRSDAAQSLLLRQMMLRDTDGDANFCGELKNGVFYVSVGESPSFQYHSFFADFGPLGLNSVTCLSRCLEGLLRCCAAYSWSTDNDDTTSNNNASGGVFGPRPGGSDGADSNKTGEGCADKTTSHGNIPIVFCSGMKNHERANAACLLACFCVATLRWTASATWHIFQHAYPPLIPFRDAGCGVSTFPLGILDVISGLEKAVAFGWYDVRTFDLAEYERLRRCDCSWVVPHMFLALSSPNRSIPCRSPKVYTKLFQQLKVTLLVRLNEPLYKRETFLASGIQHVDLQFTDGTAPNDDIINRFLKTVEPIVLPQEQRIKKRQDKQTSPNHYHHHRGIHRKQMKKNNLLQGDKTVEEKKHMSGGTIAMHCHAGLGRTGTLICVYLIRHCGFTARESIGWTRLCRPGSVIGVQQSFLERLEWRISPFAKKSHMMRRNLDPRMYGSRSISAGSNYTCEIRDMRQTMTSSSPTLPTTTTAAAAAAVTGCRPATAITMATTKNTAEQLLLLKKQQQQQRAVVYDTSCARRLSLTEIFKNPSSFFIALKKKTSSHHNYVGKLLRSVGEQQQQQQQYTEGNHSLMTGQGGGSTTNTQTDVWMSSEEKAAPQFPVAHMSLQQSQPQPAMPSLAASHAANPAKQEDNESNTQERLVLLPGNDDHINRSQKSHQTQLIPSHPNPLSILCSATTSTAPWQAPTVTAEVQAIGQSSRLQKERRVITMMGNSNTSTSTTTNNNSNNNVTIVKHVDMDLVNNVDPQFRLSGFTSFTNMSPNDENKSMTSAAARCLRASPSFGPPFRTTTRLAARKHLQREETTLLTREEVEAVAAAATDPGWGGMAVRLAPWKKKKYI